MTGGSRGDGRDDFGRILKRNPGHYEKGCRTPARGTEGIVAIPAMRTMGSMAFPRPANFASAFRLRASPTPHQCQKAQPVRHIEEWKRCISAEESKSLLRTTGLRPSSTNRRGIADEMRRPCDRSSAAIAGSEGVVATQSNSAPTTSRASPAIDLERRPAGAGPREPPLTVPPRRPRTPHICPCPSGQCAWCAQCSPSGPL